MATTNCLGVRTGTVHGGTGVTFSPVAISSAVAGRSVVLRCGSLDDAEGTSEGV